MDIVQHHQWGPVPQQGALGALKGAPVLGQRTCVLRETQMSTRIPDCPKANIGGGVEVSISAGKELLFSSPISS